MKIAGALVYCGLAMACGSMWHGDQKPPDPCPENSEKDDACVESVERITLRFKRCERQRIQLMEGPPIVKHVTKVVEKPGPPKICAKHLPKLIPIKTVECADGYLCVDARNQRAWLNNELAMRKWSDSVMSCERAP